MKLCKVIGSFVATVKHPCYQGRALLVVQPLGWDLEPSGASFPAVDAVGAGAGETVLVCEEGRSGQIAFEVEERTPLKTAIVAICDSVDVSIRKPGAKRDG